MIYIPNEKTTIESISTALANAGAKDIYPDTPKYPANDDKTIYPENLIALNFDWEDEKFDDLVNAVIETLSKLTFPIETVGMLEICRGYFPELQASIILGNLESFLSRDINDRDQWHHIQFGF